MHQLIYYEVPVHPSALFAFLLQHLVRLGILYILCTRRRTEKKIFVLDHACIKRGYLPSERWEYGRGWNLSNGNWRAGFLLGQQVTVYKDRATATEFLRSKNFEPTPLRTHLRDLKTMRICASATLLGKTFCCAGGVPTFRNETTSKLPPMKPSYRWNFIYLTSP